MTQPSRSARRPPALLHRNYRVFLATQGVSVVGTWMQNLGQAWLVLQLSGDPLVLGLVVAAQGFPVVVLGLFGGVVADRVDKRRLIAVTQSLMLLLALGLGLLCLTGLVAVWHVVLFALAVGCVYSIDMPARQAFVVELVGPNDVGSAVGLNSTIYSVGRLIGPAVAGLAIAAATSAFADPTRGTGVAFLVNAASFGTVLLGLLLMRESELFPSERVNGPRRVGAIAREIGEGIRFVVASRTLAATLLVPGLIAIVAVNFNVLVPVLAQEAGLDAGGLGLLMASAGLGSLLSAFRIGLGGAAGPRVIVGGAVLLATAEILIGLTAIPALVLVLLFFGGAGASGMRTATNTSIQMATPSHLRGRVMSIFTIVFEGASPAGGLLVGALAGAAGGRVAFAVTGVAAMLLAALAGSVLLRRPREVGATA